VASAGEYHPEGVKVYNFEVEGDHTYFVEDGTGSQTAIWVHNKCIFEEDIGRWRDLETGQFVSGNRIGKVTPRLGNHSARLISEMRCTR